MAETEQIEIIGLNLPDDKYARTWYRPEYTMLLRQPLLDSIRGILKPTTSFVDSVLLDKKESLETTNISELNPTLSEMDALVGGGCFSMRAVLERAKDTAILEMDANLIFSTISDLKTLLRDDHFMSPTTLMHIMANYAAQRRFDKINFDEAQKELEIFHFFLSWDAKAINVMGCFVFKFLEFLGFLLLDPSQRITELASSMEALKENPVSLVGTVLESVLDKLNTLIKLTLKVIECISELNLLPDTEHNKFDLFSRNTYWAILSVMVCYIQITLVMENGKVAYELCPLICYLSNILKDLESHTQNCKQEIDEMEAHLQEVAHFEDAFSSSIEMPELMKRFLYSKDGGASLIDGSTKSKVDLDVLKKKRALFVVSDLDTDTRVAKNNSDYEIVWVPFVLKWTEELRQKFEDLKSKMNCYIVSYDSPTAGMWHMKGRYFLIKGRPEEVEIDLQNGHKSPKSDPRWGRAYGNFNNEDQPYILVDRLPGGGSRIAWPVQSSLYGNKKKRARKCYESGDSSQCDPKYCS